MKSVFMLLQTMDQMPIILLNPSAKECELYITNKECIIVRPLCKESPIHTIGDVSSPTIEKLLVDAAIDKELNYVQGNEIYHIFNNALTRYNVNKKRLLRYASRRNRKELINNITQVSDVYNRLYVNYVETRHGTSLG